MKNFVLKTAWASLILLIGFTAKAQHEEARMMVHLLDYIAVDYSMAVEDGRIISSAEYQEMQEFAATVSDMGTETPNSVQSDILLLQNLIDEKASQKKISSVSSGIKKDIISLYKLQVAPKRWPVIESGRKLYTMHCGTCHGPQGKGNGALAIGLEPAPTNFHEPDKANGLSPFQAYNTIRLGVANTAMRAYSELSDDEVWDLAFYVLSLPHQDKNVDLAVAEKQISEKANLEMLASSNNEELKEKLDLKEDAPSLVSALRLYPKELAERGEGDYLDKAKRMISQAAEAYAQGREEEARTLALSAYLEGVEPIEVQLRAENASFVADLEEQLARMRSSIEKGKKVERVNAETEASILLLEKAQVMLSEREFSDWLAFLMSFSIILREGLEAFLVVITILGIIRAMKLRNAAAWVHAGWIAAIASGYIMWLAADRFFTFNGADREIMEGAIALFAVGVLLYVGFWMHSKSEANKWQAYVKSKIQVLARKENMLGLAFLSFLVVFREAFESVLFLSTLSLELGDSHQAAFGSGIIVAFVLLAVLSVLMLRYSKKIPITKLFKYSAVIISFLAIVLVGKGVHALQEAGVLSISSMPVSLRWSLIGLYPSWETFLSQVFIFALVIFLWNLGSKAMKKPLCATEKEKSGSAEQKRKLEAEEVT